MGNIRNYQILRLTLTLTTHNNQKLARIFSVWKEGMGAVRIVEICFVHIITDPALIYTYRKSLSDPSRHFLINEAILYALLLNIIKIFSMHYYQNIILDPRGNRSPHFFGQLS